MSHPPPRDTTPPPVPPDTHDPPEPTAGVTEASVSTAFSPAATAFSPAMATIGRGRLRDVVTSVSDPFADLFLPDLPMAAWKQLPVGGLREELVAALIAWQSAAAALPRSTAKGAALPHARQRQPEREALERLERDGRATYLATLQTAQRQSTIDPGSALVALADRASRGARGEVVKLTKDPAYQAIARSARLYIGLVDRFRTERLADACDLRRVWFRPRNQKKTAGCVGWAVADLLWRQRRAPLDVPSARYLWMAAKEMDGEGRPTTFIRGAGTSLRAALHVAREFGVALESELPSKEKKQKLYKGSVQSFYDIIAQRKIGDVVNLGRDKKLWLKWIELGRPVVCSLKVGRSFAEVGRDGRIASFDPEEHGLYRHAVLLVGYEGTQLQEAFERGQTTDVPAQLLIRNSEGKSWGDRGQAWMRYQDFQAACFEGFGVLEAGWDRPGRDLHADAPKSA